MKKQNVSQAEAEKPEIQPNLTREQKIRKFLILLAGLIAFNAFVWGSLYYSVFKNDQEAKSLSVAEGSISELRKVEVGEEKEVGVSPTPRPIPFKELTIPYLRSRSYASSLSELELVSQNANYTSYLTSYSSDGLRIYAQLTIPTGEAPEGGWPAIVFVHGYIPPQNYQTLSNYSSYVDYLADSGFVVLKTDLRGHGNSEGEPGGAYYSGDYIIDVLNARAALAKTDYVNPEKIGLWGHSMAGNVVSRALAAAPEIPAIVIWAGAVYTYEDFSQFRIQDSSYQPPPEDSKRREKRQELFQTHGSFDKDSDFWKQVPMTNYLDDIKGAISINHAVNDNVVNIDYSRNFKRILEDTDIVHELNEYSSGGHNITGVAFNQAMSNTVSFFNQHLN